MSSWSAFRHAIRFHACPPAWTEECDVITALQPWHSLMPAAREALQIEGWSWTQDGACITRLDEEGRTRTFRVGVDRPAVLFDWLVIAHRKRLFHNCGRIAKSLHRSDWTGSLASGPDLPAPQPNMVPLYRGHQACWQAAGTDRDVRKAAMAAGLSVWHEHAGIQLCEGDPRRVCKCKKLLPSRPHLMWSCPAFTLHRQEVSQPIDRAQARLYAVALPPVPPHDAQAPSRLEQALEKGLLAGSQQIFVATDGSLAHETAAWAVHVPGVDTSVASAISVEDQSAYRAEVEAIRKCLQGLCQVASRGIGLGTQVVIVSDCHSALHLLSGGCGEVPLLSKELHARVSELKSVGFLGAFTW